MNPLDANIILTIAVALAIGLAVCALVVSNLSARRLRVALLNSEQRLERLDKQLKMALSGAAGMGQRVLLLEQKLQQLQKQSDTAPDNSDGAIAYTQAMRLLEQGVKIDTVAASCGLSDAEANLMAMIHQHKEKAA